MEEEGSDQYYRSENFPVSKTAVIDSNDQFIMDLLEKMQFG